MTQTRSYETAARPIRYGIVGAGLMGLEHIRYIDHLEGAELVAACDPYEGSLRSARETAAGSLATFSNPETMLASCELDALVIASPNYTHAAVLDQLWDSGKHLLVEKPLCTTLDDCRRVLERSQTHDAVFWVAMEYRYMAPLERLVEEVRAGTAGELVMLSIREHRMPFLPKVGDWNRFSRNTGGTLVEKCCHYFDLMRLILDSEPVRVSASAAQDVNHLDERYDGETPDIWDNGFVIVDFESGARALLDLCMFSESGRHREEITATGSKGKVECFIPKSEVVIAQRDTKGYERHSIAVPQELLRLGHHHGSTFTEHQRFCAAIRGEGPVEVTALDGLRAVAIGVAAQMAASEHRVVEMSEVL